MQHVRLMSYVQIIWSDFVDLLNDIVSFLGCLMCFSWYILVLHLKDAFIINQSITH